MIIQFKSNDWLNSEKDKYKKINKDIYDFLELLKAYVDDFYQNNGIELNNINYNNENDGELLDLRADLYNIIIDAVRKDNVDFFKFVINNGLINDIFDTDIEVSNKYNIEDNTRILDYAFYHNKCKVSKFLFDGLNNDDKKDFIESIKLGFKKNNNSEYTESLNDIKNIKNFLNNNKCYIGIVKPYLKNIESVAALRIIRKSKLPRNITNYILKDMMGVKTIISKTRKGGKRRSKTRKIRT